MEAHARSASSLLGAAIIAGIVGGIVVDTFLSISHHISPIVLWTGMASIVSVKTATTFGSVFVGDLVGTAVFYALPMAFVLARASRASAA